MSGVKQGFLARRSKPRGASSGDGASQMGKVRGYHTFMEDMESSLPDWHLDAECSRESPEKFFYEGRESIPLLEKGIGICNTTCTVKAQCLESANRADLYWGVRGGQLPGAISSESIPAANSAISKKPDRACKRGHKRWGHKESTGKWYCMECRRLLQAGAIEAEKIKPGLPGMEPCIRGHNEWSRRKNSSGTYINYCKVCNRERTAAQRGS